MAEERSKEIDSTNHLASGYSQNDDWAQSQSKRSSKAHTVFQDVALKAFLLKAGGGVRGGKIALRIMN
jgi:hypothetical protein